MVGFAVSTSSTTNTSSTTAVRGVTISEQTVIVSRQDAQKVVQQDAPQHVQQSMTALLQQARRCADLGGETNDFLVFCVEVLLPRVRAKLLLADELTRCGTALCRMLRLFRRSDKMWTMVEAQDR